MKTVLSKIISFIAAAVMLSAGLAAVPNPDPENSIPVTQVESEHKNDNNGGEDNQSNSKYIDKYEEVDQ